MKKKLESLLWGLAITVAIPLVLVGSVTGIIYLVDWWHIPQAGYYEPPRQKYEG